MISDPELTDCTLAVHDLDEALCSYRDVLGFEVREDVEATGAEVMQEPVDRAHGVRDCAFRDPSGNMLRFTRTLDLQVHGRTSPATGTPCTTWSRTAMPLGRRRRLPSCSSGTGIQALGVVRPRGRTEVSAAIPNTRAGSTK
ncbi:hypothetical protein B0I31_104533 [Saccharothrix carnea]|uniref:Glyoxalase/bleomycin resistance protein/dioxygenase superfamily protein n=1 Tax=Saccharothrix carnea TaxID=1280637 RepID=A0A2P8ICP9_SACCR|nr:hypothetical protein B0I31_104533 [Saccharothrix carnea]